MIISVPPVGAYFRTQSNDYLGEVLEVISTPKAGSFRIRYQPVDQDVDRWAPPVDHAGPDRWTTWTVR